MRPVMRGQYKVKKRRITIYGLLQAEQKYENRKNSRDRRNCRHRLRSTPSGYFHLSGV